MLIALQKYGKILYFNFSHTKKRANRLFLLVYTLKMLIFVLK